MNHHNTPGLPWYCAPLLPLDNQGFLFTLETRLITPEELYRYHKPDPHGREHSSCPPLRYLLNQAIRESQARTTRFLSYGKSVKGRFLPTAHQPILDQFLSALQEQLLDQNQTLAYSIHRWPQDPVHPPAPNGPEDILPALQELTYIRWRIQPPPTFAELLELRPRISPVNAAEVWRRAAKRAAYLNGIDPRPTPRPRSGLPTTSRLYPDTKPTKG